MKVNIKIRNDKKSIKKWKQIMNAFIEVWLKLVKFSLIFLFYFSEALNMILSSESPDSEDLNDQG